jgi:aminopeptidase N
MLRGVVGDAAFWRGIRGYYRTHRDGSASTADFRRAMEEASERDLGWFFDQWLTRGGMLNVRARWDWDAKKGTLRLDVEQTQSGRPFRMPIEVGVEVDGEQDLLVEQIEIRDRRETFTFPLETEPRAVVLDPRTLVLMDADTRVEPAPQR